MKARKLSPKPYLVTVVYPGGHVRTLESPTERVARERILYVLHDNTNMGITAANRHANAVEPGQRYIVPEYGGFEFYLETMPDLW